MINYSLHSTFVCTARLLAHFYNVPSELKRCYPSGLYVYSSVRPSRNVRLCNANKWLDLEAPIFVHICMLIMFIRQSISSKLSTSLTHFQCQRFESSTGLFICNYLTNGDRYDKHCYGQHIGSCMWPFDWHIYISPWPILKIKVKIMHIWTANISQMVTDRRNIAVANKYNVANDLQSIINHVICNALVKQYSLMQTVCLSGARMTLLASW